MQDILLKHIVTHLLELCKQELNLTELPKIQLISDKSAINGTSFGQFVDDKIQVITLNRHPIDIARTLAHELVHWKQKVAGYEMDGSDGSEVENQANSVAGIIMRKFGKMYPDYFIKSVP